MIKSILNRINFKNTIPFDNKPTPVRDYFPVKNKKIINSIIQQEENNNLEAQEKENYFKNEQFKQTVKNFLNKDQQKDNSSKKEIKKTKKKDKK